MISFMPLVVLIVDDDAVDREAVRRHLQRLDPAFEIEEAATGAEAANRLAIRRYDFVFLDHRLPDMDGVALLRNQYDAEADQLPAPFIMLTGQGNEAVMAQALRWGAHDYLVKDSLTVEGVRIALSKAREFFELKQSRRKAEELLRQAQKMEAVGQLASGVAHDFNNLLTIVLGNTRMMQKRLTNGGELDLADLAAKIDAIDTAARRGAELIRRLTIFSRQTALQDDVVDINACVRETCELLQRSLGALIRVECVSGAETWPVRIDRSPFENALIYIAINARDALPTGGTLTIEMDNVTVDDEYLRRHPSLEPGDYVLVAMSYTGTGMPVRHHVFEPFSAARPPGEVTGLAMVDGFVQQSGGHIHVDSEAGHGTVFRMYLPTVKLTAANAPPPPPPLGGTETILVVEDDPEVLLVTQTMLERLGYHVMAAESGPVALELLRREHKRIDLLFTDIVMPGGLSGSELVRQAQGYYPSLRALYTSGYTENAIPGYKLLPGEELLGKPYRKEALAKKVREALQAPAPRAAATSA